MSDETVRLYEGLFLLNPAPIASNLTTATQTVREVLDRAHAEVISISKWDERKLAYEIRGAKRGLYMLAYFRTAGQNVAHIERDVNLSDQILRAMIVRADHIGQTELELAQQEQVKTQAAAKLQGEAPAPAAEEAPVVQEAHA
jgi:small subunit ribosomal protein S6